VSSIIVVTWDGGGNVDVALGVGLAVQRRGHTVIVAGPETVRTEVEGLDLEFVELGPAPPTDAALRRDYLIEIAASMTLAQQLEAIVEARPPDLTVIDCNLAWALEHHSEVPRTVLVHTALGLYVPVWQALLDHANLVRAKQGGPPLPSAVDSWTAQSKLLVASWAQFDRPPRSARGRALYVGPVHPAEGGGPARHLVRPDSQTPLVVVSYSTEALQNGPSRLQATLDALAALPVQVLATTSGVFPVDAVIPPMNARVVSYVPHSQVMPGAQVVICHAGHGTTTAALSHGVSLVCIPGLGRDQAPIAARVAELGLGIALDEAAPPQHIAGAVHTILADSSYRRRTHRFSKRVAARPDGAERAADELERLLDHPAPGSRRSAGW
jgi:UDP:flavonoid glycosyltransferase YjiC (YdhE family)